ncbi:MAG: hypothetical protein JOZ57_00570, partial [Abitibacteriaceae bacterium]|nr:hypothetical protein [Abditibacteriaceae bacterium]
PIGQGVGGALNNLTQPDTVRSLLDFLSSVIPNHIEAHVNLDALRVDKVTLDIRGVDLRNLRVDLLVANSKNGPVQPMMGNGSNSSGNMNSNYGGAGGSSGGINYNSGIGNNYGTGGGQSSLGGNNVQLPGNVPITGSSSRNSGPGR